MTVLSDTMLKFVDIFVPAPVHRQVILQGRAFGENSPSTCNGAMFILYISMSVRPSHLALTFCIALDWCLGFDRVVISSYHFNFRKSKWEVLLSPAVMLTVLRILYTAFLVCSMQDNLDFAFVFCACPAIPVLFLQLAPPLESRAATIWKKRLLILILYILITYTTLITNILFYLTMLLLTRFQLC